MDFSFLPKKIIRCIDKINVEYLYEIRLRTNYPIKINYKNEVCYLGNNGASIISDNSLICSDLDIEYIISKATEHSLYAFNDRIKEGYLTLENGIRIGLCGECVFDDDKIQTIKNFTSLNIRIPHEINGCAKEIIAYLFAGNKFNNTLIVSPPFLGKTTLLKDIALYLNELNKYSILVIDERGEFSNIKGENIDSIKYSNKLYAFNFAIRAMSPSIIITDEIASERDWQCVQGAIASGVKIIASCHSDSVEHLLNKKYVIKNLFDVYVVLENKNRFGQAKYIYDRNLNIL